MFAVVDIAGFQEILEKGSKLRVQSLAGKVGDTVTFEKILLVGGDGAFTLGAPHIADMIVKATIVAHGKGDKIQVRKFKRRKRYQRLQGHRQGYTDIEVTELEKKN